MSIKATIQFGVVFGRGDSSDWMDFDIRLPEEAEAAYQRALKLRIPFDEVPELEKALADAYSEIEAEALDNMWDDEYVQECAGQVPMDEDKLNALVEARDPHTMEFFGLEGMTEEELEEWDAYDLDEIPDRCDFEENFEPISPFEEGWELNIQWPDPNEDELETEEAVETLKELFQTANGDYSEIHDYVDRCECSYFEEESLERLAEILALALGITDYTE